MAARRRRNDDCSSAESGFLHSLLHYEVGELLFAGTFSGRFEVAKIIKIDRFQEHCYVQFENGKKHWVSFGNLQQKDLSLVSNLCCLCLRKARSETRPLLRCHSCKLGFHRHCHSPIVRRLDPEEATRWQCQICFLSSSSGVSDNIFSKLAEESRPERLFRAHDGDIDACSDDEYFLSRTTRGRKKLGYNLALLSWDKNHLSNSENCYCYCGKPGKWDVDMLRCTRCLQWFHRGCLSHKTDMLVTGDLLYYFFCSICLKHEFYHRLQVTWKDLAHLALYNLTRRHKDVNFFEFESDIVPWVRAHWRNFHAGKLNGIAQKEREKNLLEALVKNPSRFTKEQSQLPGTRWHLKEAKILVAPDIDLGQFQSPPGRLQIEQLLASLTTTKGCNNNLEKRLKKRKRRNVDPMSKCQCQKRLKNDSSEPTLSSAHKGQSASFNYPTMLRDTGVQGMLDEMIPVPSSYDSVNHPFKTTIEKEDEMKILECRRKALKLTVCKMVARFEKLHAAAELPPPETVNKKQELVPAVRTPVNGQLFNFNGVDVANHLKRQKNNCKKRATYCVNEEDPSDDSPEWTAIRYFGPKLIEGRVIGKRTTEGNKQQLLIEWRDADRT